MIPRFLTNLPSLTEPIIGREQALENLAATLTDAQRVVLVNGMGGIGKTTMATAYAEQNQDHFKHIAWIEQSGDFVTDLITNTVLLRNLGLELSAEPEADAKAILNALSNLAGPSLLVIDNADEKLAPFRDYLPKAPNWQVLITSREELDFAKILTLDFLSEEAAMELFYSHYHHDKNDELLRTLLSTIDYHTLTIELLAKIAQECAIPSVAKITELLKARGLAIERRANIRSAHSKDQRIEYLFPYLQAIFDIGDDFTRSQQQLLKDFVGLPPIPVPLEHLFAILLEDATKEAAKDDLRFDLKELSRKGFLLHDPKKASFKMHRVIQEVIQKKYGLGEEDLARVMNGVADLLSIDQAKDNPIDKFALVVYGEHLLTAPLVFLDRSTEFAHLQSNLATVYQYLGRYDEAAGLLEEILLFDLKNFGELHPSVARRQSDLALVYKDLGRYDEAASLLEFALRSNLDFFGELHPNVAIRQSNLAIIYQALGRYEDAVVLLELALRSDLENFGELHPSVARNQSNLALVYKDLGLYGKAAALLEDALRSNLKNFSEFHPSVITSQSNLGLVYQQIGRYEKALDLLKGALRSNLENLAELHPTVATSQSNLAILYQDLGRSEEAMVLLEAALRSDLENFGELHPSVARSQSNLATVYQALGRYEEAEDLLEAALRSDLENFGELHPNTARNQSNLALVYKDVGCYEEAAVLLEGALRSNLENFGELHLNVATNQSNLATVYQALGRYEEAAALLEGALYSDLKNFGELHPSVATTQSNLALVYENLGRYEEAAALLGSALRSDLENFGELHPNVAIRQWNLANIYKSIERKEEAVSLSKSAYQIFYQALGKDHPNTKVVKDWLEDYDLDL